MHGSTRKGGGAEEVIARTAWSFTYVVIRSAQAATLRQKCCDVISVPPIVRQQVHWHHVVSASLEGYVR